MKNTIFKGFFCLFLLATVGSFFVVHQKARAAVRSETQIQNPQQLSTTIPAADLQRLATVIAEVKKYYVKPVSDRDIFDNAISGLLTGLDPHSEYLKKDDLESLEMITVGRFGGIGIEVIPDDGLIKIISPIDDTPAAKAGIKPGDIIIQVDSKLVKDMTLNQAIKLMRGPKGSKVSLTILRKNAMKPMVFHLTRDIVKLKTVKEQLLEPGYGYIRIALFQEYTDSDLIKAIVQLNKQTTGHVKGLILDLRNNPGGLLDSAVDVSDNFLDARKLGRNNTIVYTKGNDESSHLVARAKDGELLPNVPMVVLINEGSASAAEVVAGALQDHKRAILLGKKSFGKGSVQTLLPVDNESAIKLTTALYYTPSGRSIQAKGIEPDIDVDDLKVLVKNDNENELANINEASLADHLANGGDDGSNAVSVKNAKNAGDLDVIDRMKNEKLGLANKDYQLYEALQLLKGLNAISQ